MCRREMIGDNPSERMTKHRNLLCDGQVIQKRNHIGNIGSHAMWHGVVGFTEPALVQCDHAQIGGKVFGQHIEIRRTHPVTVQRNQRLPVATGIKEGQDDTIVFKAVPMHEFTFRFPVCT